MVEVIDTKKRSKESIKKQCRLEDKELYLKRRDLNRAIYAGAITIGISIPVVIINYIPTINNIINNKDITARTVGTVGLAIGTNLMVSGFLRGIEYWRSLKDMNRKIRELKDMQR